MNYFFELGTNRALSAAEIFSVVRPGGEFRFVGDKILAGKIDGNLNERELMMRLGGCVKIGRIICEDLDKIEVGDLLDILQTAYAGTGKFNYGISHYGSKKINLKVLGMEIKKHFREQGVSCRWVTGKEPVLSSVIVEQNGLVGRGAELAIIEDSKKYSLGLTGAVQPWKEFSRRDYGRPARDDRSGMLPPKLARIMLNLALGGLDAQRLEKAVILDPFCGSGTVLGEALYLGAGNVIGSDLSPKAIADARANLEWEYKDRATLPVLHNLDAKELGRKIKKASVDAIVSEPYLGPQRGHIDIAATSREMNGLYREVFKQFDFVLKPKGRAVFILPVFRASQKNNFLELPFSPAKFRSLLPEKKLIKCREYQPKRGSIIYGRADQRVWREIFVLEKIT